MFKRLQSRASQLREIPFQPYLDHLDRTADIQIKRVDGNFIKRSQNKRGRRQVCLIVKSFSQMYVFGLHTLVSVGENKFVQPEKQEHHVFLILVSHTLLRHHKDKAGLQTHNFGCTSPHWNRNHPILHLIIY